MSENITDMSENITDATSAEQETPRALYRSGYTLNRAFFDELASTGYRKIGIVFAVYLFILLLETANFIVLGGDYLVIFALIISFFSVFVYLRIRKSGKTAYERNLVAAGKETVHDCRLFEDRIEVSTEQGQRTYGYGQITKLIETTNFLLLHLRYNLYVVIDKNTLDASAEEVKSFLTGKCGTVRKKKFRDCRKDKKRTVALLITILAVSLAGCAMAACERFVPLTPVHFRGLENAVTVSDARNVYGEPDEVRTLEYSAAVSHDVYDKEYLGVKGEMDLLSYRDGRYIAAFIIDPRDFDSESAYLQAVQKTYRYFDRVLSGWEKYNEKNEQNSGIRWSKTDCPYSYIMYRTTFYNGFDAWRSEAPEVVTVFAFSRLE